MNRDSPFQILGHSSGIQSVGHSDAISKSFAASTKKELIGHKKHCVIVAWNCEGKLLASGSGDFMIRIWTLNSSTAQSIELKGHTDLVDSLCWHPSNPDRLASASTDKTVKIWDVKKGTILHSFSLGGENINIAWNPDGETIAVGNRVDMIYILDIKNLKILKKHQYHFEVNEFGWNKTGNLMYLTTAKGCVDIVNYPEIEISKSFFGHNGNVYSLSFHPNGNFFALGAADGLITVWDNEEFICLKTLSKQDYPIRSISFNFDGTFIASGSSDSFIQIYDFLNGEIIYSLNANCPINSVSWNPKGNFLAWAGEESNKSLKGSVQVFGMAK